jgi:hypothetical protein
MIELTKKPKQIYKKLYVKMNEYIHSIHNGHKYTGEKVRFETGL